MLCLPQWDVILRRRIKLNKIIQKQLDLIRIADKFDLKVLAGELAGKAEGVYVGDLLSNVIAKAQKGDVWLTVQGHLNVVAVAELTEVAAVIIVEGQHIDQDTITKAKEKEVLLLSSEESAFVLGVKIALESMRDSASGKHINT